MCGWFYPQGLVRGRELEIYNICRRRWWGATIVGSAPAGRFGGSHVVMFGDSGAAKAKGLLLLLLLRVASPQSPPRPSRTFLLCTTICGGSPSDLGFGVGLFWFPLYVTLGM